MHEAAVLRDLVRKVNEVAGVSPTSSVARVRLWVGALSHLKADDLVAGWRRVAAGTRSSEAVIETVVSDDTTDPRSQGVVLLSVDLADGPSSPGRSATTTS